MFEQLLNLSSSQRDVSGPLLGALSNNKWLGGGVWAFSSTVRWPYVLFLIYFYREIVNVRYLKFPNLNKVNILAMLVWNPNSLFSSISRVKSYLSSCISVEFTERTLHVNSWLLNIKSPTTRLFALHDVKGSVLPACHRITPRPVLLFSFLPRISRSSAVTKLLFFEACVWAHV